MGGRNRLHPPFFVRFRTLQRGLSKKGGRSEERPESREETPKEGIRRQVAAFRDIWCAAQKSNGQKPKGAAKARSCTLSARVRYFCIKAVAVRLVRRMRQSFTISASHAPREFSDEIRPDARPAEGAERRGRSGSF